MASIYELMKKDWKTYCLMAGIAYIQEMKKPHPHKITKTYKGKSSQYICYHSIQINGKCKDIIKTWFNVTKYWEKKLNQNFIGPTFKQYKLDKEGKYYFGLSPNWLYNILKTVKSLPSQYANNLTIERLKTWKKGINKIKNNKYSLYRKLLTKKILAAGAYIISFDLEFRGITVGRPSLCMSNTYKDFLEFMLKVSNKWGWSTSNKLSSVNINYSLNLGVNATPQSEFRISIKKLNDIYNLAGPLADKHKDKCINFHINRSKNYKNNGRKYRNNNTKQRLLKLLKKFKKSTTTELQFYVNVGNDVILQHLHNLKGEDLIEKERKGKKYLWSIKNAS